MNIKYVTSNDGKFAEAQHILAGWGLERVSVDLQEVQGERHEIIQAKAREALRLLNCPLIVEDVCVCCRALKGLPGPYIKEFLLRLGADGLADLIHRYDDHFAQAICTAAFIQPGDDPVCFEGILEGTIVKARGMTQHSHLSWNGIFLPHGKTQTFGECSMKELSKISMRSTALTRLRHYLENQTLGH